MKTEKKRVGTKVEIRAIKNRERRIATAIFLVFILLIVILSAYFAYSLMNQSSNQSLHKSSEQNVIEPDSQFKPENPNSQLKATIVDHLSLTSPNQTFIETAASILTKSGYTVDYFSGKKVTVELYRNLATHGYKIVILRVHSALRNQAEGPVVLFTSQTYSKTQYISEQLADSLLSVAYTDEDVEKGILYFGIHPNFIKHDMKGAFDKTVIIAMGCDSLKYAQMAEAFMEKGSKAYIGWNASVSASHTDTATTRLLQHIITANQTIKQAVDDTMKEVEADPAYESLLSYYPLEVGDYTIQNIVGS